MILSVSQERFCECVCCVSSDRFECMWLASVCVVMRSRFSQKCLRRRPSSLKSLARRQWRRRSRATKACCSRSLRSRLICSRPSKKRSNAIRPHRRNSIARVCCTMSSPRGSLNKASCQRWTTRKSCASNGFTAYSRRHSRSRARWSMLNAPMARRLANCSLLSTAQRRLP